jgi:hypothetical protein
MGHSKRNGFQVVIQAHRIEGVRGLKFKREDVLNLIERIKPEEFYAEETE